MSILMYNSTQISPTPVVVIESQLVGSPDGAFQGKRETWRLNGEVLGATPAAVQSAYRALDKLFNAAGGDLVLYADDGTTIKHSLINSQTLLGTKVSKPFSFPKGDGAELATLRTWSVEITGIKIMPGAPSGTAWGSYTTSSVTDAQGQIHCSISGQFQGPGAMAAVTAALAAGCTALGLATPMIENVDVKKNPDTQTVDFTYQYVDKARSRSVISFVESVSLEPSIQDFVFRYPLGGGSPVQQTTITTTSKATQSGEAVGRNGYPAPPTGLWSTNLKRQRVTRRSPRLTEDNQYTEYGIQWEYEFEFSATQSDTYPNNPAAG
jgi:hypothetical protein